MPKGKVKTSWIRRNPEKRIVPKYDYKKPEGLTELTNYLEISAPKNVLRHLHNFQDKFCNHVFYVVASVRRSNGSVKEVIACTKCSLVNTRRKVS